MKNTVNNTNEKKISFEEIGAALGLANYQQMKYFPLYIKEDFDDLEFWFEDMPKLNETLERVNAGLRWHKITVQAGRMSGAQYVIEQEEPDWDMQNKMFPQRFNGATREEVYEMVKAERAVVREWLRNYARDDGFKYVAQQLSWTVEGLKETVENGEDDYWKAPYDRKDYVAA